MSIVFADKGSSSKTQY